MKSIAILTSPRSGSHFLSACLEEATGLKDADEILNRLKPGEEADAIQKHKEDYIWIIHSCQVMRLNITDLEGTNQICLERQNKIDQLISAYILQNRIYWHKNLQHPITIELNEQHLYLIMATYLGSAFLRKDMYSNIPIIYYEDLEQNPLQEINKVLHAIGLPQVESLAIPSHRRFKHRKANQSTVTNYDEIKEWITSVFSNSSADDILEKIGPIVYSAFGSAIKEVSPSVIAESKKMITRYLNNHGIHDQ